jgi:hypothetical protein
MKATRGRVRLAGAAFDREPLDCTDMAEGTDQHPLNTDPADSAEFADTTIRDVGVICSFRGPGVFDPPDQVLLRDPHPSPTDEPAR